MEAVECRNFKQFTQVFMLHDYVDLNTCLIESV
jgi:hypothetical protein